MRGDRLKEARQKRGLTQQDLAERAAIALKQISRYENGENDPTADVLTRLAKALEVSIDWLVGLVDNPTGYLTDDDLTAMERRLLWELRQGRIVEAIQTVIDASTPDVVNEPPVTTNDPAVPSESLNRAE